MPAPTNIFGMNLIPLIFLDWLPLKRLKQSCALSQVRIQPVELPKIPPSFTKQYSLKGGHKEIDDTVLKLLKADFIE